MASAFCAALCLVAGDIAILGPGDRGIRAALLATARLGFVFFWPAYAGGALVSLFGSRLDAPRRHAKDLGLAFASVLLVHLGLVFWLCVSGAPPPISTFVFFGGAATLTYAIALFSIPSLQQALGSTRWRLLRVIGLNYVAYAFIVDFLKDPLHRGILHFVAYLPFSILAVAGPLLRVLAWLRRFGSGHARTALRAG
jgi:hypothetical protein